MPKVLALASGVVTEVTVGAVGSPIYSVTVDAGSTPVRAVRATVTVTGVQAGDNVLASVAMPSGASSDELELQPMWVHARVTAANTVEVILAADGPFTGQRTVTLAAGTSSGVGGGPVSVPFGFNRTRLGSGLPGRLLGGLVSVTPTLEWVYGWPVACAEAVTWDAWKLTVSTGQAGAVAACALYSVTDFQTGTVGTMVAGSDTSGTSLATVGAKVATLAAPLTTPPGLYIAAAVVSGSATAPTVYGLQFEDDGANGIDIDAYNRFAAWALVTGGATVCPGTVTVSHGNVTNTYTFATMRRS